MGSPIRKSACCGDNTHPVYAVSGNRYILVHLLDFLNVRKVGGVATVCKLWNDACADDLLWKGLYERTQVCEAGVEEWAQGLVDRPFGREAVGWEVKVYNEELMEWIPGVVMDYRNGGYNVGYFNGEVHLEFEQRSQ
ncbi:unnamed protein product, partial [Choristocarpus tenellus]